MTARGTAALVARLRRELGQRDVECLRSLERVRLLTTSQITRLHFSENSASTQARRARATLRRLRDLRLVVKLGRQVGGVKAGSSGTLFGLTGLGLAVLEVPTSQQRRRTIWEAKPYFQDHLLAVSELYVQLVEHTRIGNGELLSFEAEPTCWRRFSGTGGEPITLKPDAIVRVGIGEYELSTFIEVDLGTESLPAIRRKCQVYLRYWRSGLEQQRAGVFPRVVWLVPNVHRADGIAAVLKRLSQTDSGLFAVALAEDAVDLLARLPVEGGAR